MFPRTIPICAGLLALAACTGETDPRKAGFLDSIANQTSGTNEQRLEERRQRNNAQATANARSAQEGRKLDADRAALERRVNSTRTRISSLEKRISVAKREIPANDPRQAQLARAEKDLKQQRRELDIAAASGDQDAVLIQLRKVGLIEEELAL